MKVKYFIIFLSCFTAFMVSCDFSDSDNDGEKIDTNRIPEEYIGIWRVIKSDRYYYDIGNTVVINKDRISINDHSGYNPATYIPIGDTSYNYSFSKRNDIYNGMVEFSFDLWGGNNVYYLIPFIIENKTVSFSGTVVTINNSSRSASRAVTGLGGIQIIINNLSNPDKPGKPTKTDSDGAFVVDDVIPGDNYEVILEDQINEFTPIADGDNIGIITIKNGTNFKISRNFNSEYYANENINISLSIKNTGNMLAQATTYKIIPENGLLINSTTSGILGTFYPSETKGMGLNIKCDNFSGSDHIWKKIFFELYDPINNITWEDSVSVLFYRVRPPQPTYRTIQYTSDITRNADLFIYLTIISPSGKIYNGGTLTQSGQPGSGGRRYKSISSVEVENGEYTFIITNSNNDGMEGMYSVYTGTSSNVPQLPNPPSVDDIIMYKPNHTLIQAAKVSLPFRAYSLRDHLDFYKVTF